MRENMMTSSTGKIFRVTGPLCWEFTGPHTKANEADLWCFFDQHLNKRLCKQTGDLEIVIQKGSTLNCIPYTCISMLTAKSTLI